MSGSKESEDKQAQVYCSENKQMKLVTGLINKGQSNWTVLKNSANKTGH